MRTRLLLISHPATAAQRKGTFPADDPLDARAAEEVTAFRASHAALLNADAALSSPAACALETAQALGLVATTVPDLADADFGRWRGRRLLDVANEETDALDTWTRDPSSAPHGGESFDALTLRVGGWLDAFEYRGTVIAVTHAGVIRAALMYVLQAPSAAFARIEVPPLSVVELQRSERGWAWWPAA
ncbi:histidine phosphatase family protein [Paraburkholderia terrae]|uniref:Phosphoglycerate mutase n=1 Tax=Paraburkholderia terrae TaxID=311230 RepID=A0ABM7TL84_9BURK|nr:histidine phosphatase family protein [Paraburkholderia terrae]BCZ79850.1 phosphoglycerate mutase [Paraburkholderia terrae]BDC41681.1 phosphoglycerate mutase [Paraburkholderia terrae]